MRSLLFLNKMGLTRRASKLLVMFESVVLVFIAYSITAFDLDEAIFPILIALIVITLIGLAIGILMLALISNEDEMNFNSQLSNSIESIEDSNSCKSTFNKVGWVLISIGAIDIGIMIYCIINQISYSSSLNIFALIAGVLLVRGSIRTARFITSASAFILGVLICGFVLGSVLALIFNQDGISSINFADVVVPVVAIALFYWVYTQLRAKPVLEARLKAGFSDEPSKLAFVLGSIFPIIIGGMILIFSKGGPYQSLENEFAISQQSSSTANKVSSVVLTSRKHHGAFSYRDVLKFSLSSEGIDIYPQFPLSISLKSIHIPVESVSGCSKTCGASWDADLLIEKTGTEISFYESNEILNWCWKNKIPMISGKDRREWLYNKKPLPNKSNYFDQLNSREVYNHQTKLACGGY